MTNGDDARAHVMKTSELELWFSCSTIIETGTHDNAKRLRNLNV